MTTPTIEILDATDLPATALAAIPSVYLLEQVPADLRAALASVFGGGRVLPQYRGKVIELARNDGSNQGFHFLAADGPTPTQAADTELEAARLALADAIAAWLASPDDTTRAAMEAARTRSRWRETQAMARRSTRATAAALDKEIAAWFAGGATGSQAAMESAVQRDLAALEADALRGVA